ncbi:MAG TPA: fatty acid--CoA ligase family protein [Verrucomicrobiae bacterium]
MLYESWRQICDHSRDDLALSDVASGRCWTFGQLARLAERGDPPPGGLAFPSGDSAEFVLEVLRAWRWRGAVCPLDQNQARPAVGDLPGGVAHVKITSASTGPARLVAFTAAQLMADAANIVATMGLRREWPNLGVISLAHSYGFSNLVLPLLLHGIPLILAGSALPESVRRAARRCKAATIAGVPALWRTWLEGSAIPGHVRLAISAGAPLALDLEREVFDRHGLKIHNFYGSSECGGIAYDGSENPRVDAACAGEPVRNVNVTIADDGCVEVRGAAVGQTYWPESSLNLREGVFRTTDLGEIKDGLLYLRGRATDQINVAGRKVLPEAIEAVLSSHPDVHACLAFGVPGADPQRGETIVACISGQAEATPEKLKQYALARLPAWQVPREWWLVETLGTNSRGKLSRAEWRQRYLARPELMRAKQRGPGRFHGSK